MSTQTIEQTPLSPPITTPESSDSMPLSRARALISLTTPPSSIQDLTSARDAVLSFLREASPELASLCKLRRGRSGEGLWMVMVREWAFWNVLGYCVSKGEGWIVSYLREGWEGEMGHGHHVHDQFCGYRDPERVRRRRLPMGEEFMELGGWRYVPEEFF